MDLVVDTHVDEELSAESDEVGVVDGWRDGYAPGAPAVHEAQAAHRTKQTSTDTQSGDWIGLDGMGWVWSGYRLGWVGGARGRV